jgi:hypothetical protein
MAKLSVMLGACTTSAQSSVQVLPALEAGINQKASDGNTLAVTLTGGAPSATSLQWQRLNGSGSWVNIAGATSGTLNYASFEADSAPTVQGFIIDGASFQGQLFQVQLRLHAERTFNGQFCEANSSPVTVKKVTAVDP